MSVSSITDPSRALLGTGFPFRRDHVLADRYVELLPSVMMKTAGIRRAGSAALDLADVACGRFDAFWEMMLSPWDIAAGMLLVREAGGVITDLSGKPCTIAHTGVVAGNAAMHEWLLKAVTTSEARGLRLR